MEVSQHSRPLWIGLLACALTPTVFLVAGLMVSYARVMVPIEAVLIVSLPASLLATYLVALPYTLWLRRRGKLGSLRLCIAGLIAGGIVLGAFGFYMSWYPGMHDQSFAFWVALQAAKNSAASGAALGLLASVALVLGAGIPIRRSERMSQEAS